MIRHGHLPGGPYHIDTRDETKKIIEDQLSQCPQCFEFFDPEGRINNGETFDPQGYDIEPRYWIDDLCKACRDDS